MHTVTSEKIQALKTDIRKLEKEASLLAKMPMITSAVKNEWLR